MSARIRVEEESSLFERPREEKREPRIPPLSEFSDLFNITYDEVAKMLYAAVRNKHIPNRGDISEMKDYVDENVAADVKYAVFQLKKLGVIDDTIKFKSGENATNTDIAVMFYNFLQLIH